MIVGKILVYGVEWCGDCTRARAYLNANRVEYDLINIDYDKVGEEFVLKHNRGFRSVPTIVFPDGAILVEPSVNQLARKIN